MNQLLRISLVLVGVCAYLSNAAGPSGVHAANLVLHFSANDVLDNGGASTPNDGDPVPVWSDLVSAADARPGLINVGNATNPPVYRNAPAGPLPGTSLMLNGQPTVQFGFNVNNGTGLDAPFIGSKNVLPNMTVVWVGAGDVVNDYHPFWTFDGSTGGHHRSAAMWQGLPGFPGAPVIPIQFDPCCGDAIVLTQDDGLTIDGGGVRINVPAVDPLLGGDATWHVFAVRFMFGGKFSLTIDGQTVTSAVNESIPSPDMDHFLSLGYLPAGGGKGNNLRMLLSDFRIYDDKLTNDELYAVGSGLAEAYGLTWAVPEPTAASLMAIGMTLLSGGLAGSRRRRV